MNYQVALNGFEQQQIVIEPSKLFAAARLLVNGEPAQQAEKRGHFKLKKDDGTEIVANFKSFLIDPVPQLVVEGTTIHVAQPLKKYEWVMACIPLLLVLAGGTIGGLLGLAAGLMNVRILRTELSPLVRYLLCGLNIFATIILFRMIMVLFFAMTVV